MKQSCFEEVDRRVGDECLAAASPAPKGDGSIAQAAGWIMRYFYYRNPIIYGTTACSTPNWTQGNANSPNLFFKARKF